MKIAFVGKGGSGKSTLAAMASRHLSGNGFRVLAIDADINQHLAKQLGMSDEEAGRIPPLGNEVHRLKVFFRGSNSRIFSEEQMIKTTPPGHGSRLLQFGERSELLDYFAKAVHGLHVMATGGFENDDLGVKCYHAKTGAVELFLNHFIDRRDEFVIVDMTAGADAFASGLFTKFDMTFAVVEPTDASLDVYRQYTEYAERYGVALRVIGNKVLDQEDATFIRHAVGKDYLVSLPFEKRLRSGASEIDVSEPMFAEPLQKIQELVLNTPQDWKRFYRFAIEFHAKNARSWANAQTGLHLEDQIDPNFSLDEYVKAH